MSVCQTAGYWSDIRKHIELELGLEDGELKKEPFFKEVVDLRNMILYENGKGDNRILRFKYFTWLKEGEFITFTKDQM